VRLSTVASPRAMGANRGWAFVYALFTAVLLPIPYYALIPVKVSFQDRLHAFGTSCGG